jgi:hypothetical protein
MICEICGRDPCRTPGFCASCNKYDAKRLQNPHTRRLGNGHDGDEEGRHLQASLPELEAALGAMPNSATWAPTERRQQY